jgi:hypothetical protein
MKSHKPNQKISTPTTTDVRSKDLESLRSDIDFLRSRISSLTEKAPEKAGVILAEWVNGRGSAPRKKKAS